MGEWVAERVDGWVLCSRKMGMGGLQKLITVLGRFLYLQGGSKGECVGLLPPLIYMFPM